MVFLALLAMLALLALLAMLALSSCVSAPADADVALVPTTYYPGSTLSCHTREGNNPHRTVGSRTDPICPRSIFWDRFRCPVRPRCTLWQTVGGPEEVRRHRACVRIARASWRRTRGVPQVSNNTKERIARLVS